MESGLARRLIRGVFHGELCGVKVSSLARKTLRPVFAGRFGNNNQNGPSHLSRLNEPLPGYLPTRSLLSSAHPRYGTYY